MKKTYIVPETSVVNIHMQQMLASSPIGSQVFDEQADDGSFGLVKENRGDLWKSSVFSEQSWSDSWD